jgi:hypothetical protein
MLKELLLLGMGAAVGVFTNSVFTSGVLSKMARQRQKQAAQTNSLSRFRKANYFLNDMEQLPQAISKYPMLVFTGGSSAFVVVNRHTPGYNLGNRPYQILFQRPLVVMAEYPTEQEMATLFSIATSAAIDRNIAPTIEDHLDFTERAGPVNWSQVVTQLVAEHKATVRENNSDVSVDSRVIESIHLTDGTVQILEPPVAVDDLTNQLSKPLEHILFSLLLGRSTTATPSDPDGPTITVDLSNESTQAVMDNRSLPHVDFLESNERGNFFIQEETDVPSTSFSKE